MLTLCGVGEDWSIGIRTACILEKWRIREWRSAQMNDVFSGINKWSFLSPIIPYALWILTIRANLCEIFSYFCCDDEIFLKRSVVASQSLYSVELQVSLWNRHWIWKYFWKITKECKYRYYLIDNVYHHVGCFCRVRVSNINCTGHMPVKIFWVEYNHAKS